MTIAMKNAINRPLVGLTMGDVAGIGPEVIAAGWADPRLHALARPLVIGDPAVLERAVKLFDQRHCQQVQVVDSPEQAHPTAKVIPCLSVAGIPGGLAELPAGTVDPHSGRAAYLFLMAAAGLARDGRIDAITTLPLNKQALQARGHQPPGSYRNPG